MLVGLEAVDGTAHGLEIVGVLEALDELCLYEHGQVVAPLRVVDGSTITAVVGNEDLVVAQRHDRRRLRHDKLTLPFLRDGGKGRQGR